MLGGVNRTELADFVRRVRERIRPEEVGLATGPRRRTPGLRREEVAQLAGMSVDYVVRLEQARAPRPSDQMLTALARALRLDDAERDHLFWLAGRPPPRRSGHTTHVRPAVLRLLNDLRDSAAFVVSDLGQFLAMNDLAKALLGDQTVYTGRESSAAWRWFTMPTARDRYPGEDHDKHSRVRVAELRAAAARRAGDPDVEELVAALLDASDEFARLWAEHDVNVPRDRRKRLIHPTVGLVDVDCETLLTPEQDQAVVLLTARPDTEAVEQLRLLQVIGLEGMTADRR
jgi:transcriptional regulator with XRE-family HTH domain